MMLRLLVAVTVFVASASSAFAHKPSDSHLRLAIETERLEGSLDVAIRDLDAALTIDGDGNGAITWGELEDATTAVNTYVTDRLALTRASTPCPLHFSEASLVEHSDGPYWSMPFVSDCDGQGTSVAITYKLLFDTDALHRALVRVDGAHAQTLIIRDAAPVTIQLDADTSIEDFITEGIWHIWHGLDHLLFLVCLILPAVYTRRGQPPRTFKNVALSVLQVVTAFTVAHSLTLAVSTLDLVRLPSRAVETAIAASVVAAALNNLVRVVDARWAVAFALGLLHGFGFSSVLVDLGLPSRELVGALFGFNLGVELGQLAFVAVLLPALYLIRGTIAYRVVLWGGSAAIAVLASIWTVQRLFT